MLKKEITINTDTVSYNYNIYKSNDLQGSIKRVKQISTKTFLNKMDILNLGPISEIMPLNCRFVEKIGTSKLFIIEEPPQMRTIKVETDMSMIVARLKLTGDLKKFGYENWLNENENPYSFHLAIPYIIYMIILDESNYIKQVNIYTRNMPLNGFGNYLCKLPLPNIDDRQTICLGDNLNKISSMVSVEVIESIKASLWSSIFNNDYIYNVQDYQDTPFVHDYLTWQYHSQNDPMFIYNVEWIPYITIGQQILKFRKSFGTKSYTQGSKYLNFLQTVFDDPVPILNSNITSLYDNATDSIIINNIPIFINDIFKLKNKSYRIESFLTTAEYTNTYIKLENTITNKIQKYKLTTKFKDRLKDCILQERSLKGITLPSGEILKPGNIVTYTNKQGEERTHKLLYMRYGLDGKFECRLGTYFIAIDDMCDISTLDLDNIICNNIKLIIGEIYFISIFTMRSLQKSLPSKRYIEAKLININFIDSHLLFRYKDIIKDEDHTLSFKQLKDGQLINLEKYRTLPHIFKSGTVIAKSQGAICKINKPSAILNKNPYVYNLTLCDILDDILKDKNHLFIEGFDLDISFKVGDKVVISDWNNPFEMLKIKTIIGFELEDDKFLNVLSIDNHGIKSKHPYLYSRNGGISINVGTIRHIVNEYKGINTGTKIKAKVRGITCFPMKDTNIIIGFLTDTGGDIPLVLCSNGATLWADTLEDNFNLISRNNEKKWLSLKHKSIINQYDFKFQSGDLGKYINSNNQSHIIFTSISGQNNNLDIHIIDSIGGINNISYMNVRRWNPQVLKSIERVGFLTPRYSIKELISQKKYRSYPNFNGMYSINSILHSRYTIPERRITNDPDLSV